jgi:dinuclear metal center YbgI/SA1388 family protein
MLIAEFVRAFDEIVPLGAVGYDRDAVGLQVGLESEAKLSRALFAYEVTAEVIAEAKSVGANLIVAFHPLIFPNLASVSDSTRTGSLVRELVRSGIAVYVVHTAFDTHTEFGTSQLMADVLELEDVRPLKPLERSLNKLTVFSSYALSKQIMETLVAAGAGRIGDTQACSFQVEGRSQFKSPKIEPATGEPLVLESVDEVRLELVCETWRTQRAVRALAAAVPPSKYALDITALISENRNFGMGAVGEWRAPLSAIAALERIQQAFGTAALRHSAIPGGEISRVALLGGAGMEFYSAARAAAADVFVTADVRYHDFYRAEHDRILLVDAGHAETERFVTRGMAQAARRALQALSASDDTLVIAQTEPNSVRYFSATPANGTA